SEYCNIVLEGLNNIKPGPQDTTEWNNIKGSALFYRAYAFHDLLQLFAKPYDKSTAASDPGIPLRMTSDVNVILKRATVLESYARITNDLTVAESLLPQFPLYKTRPSALAADAL